MGVQSDIVIARISEANRLTEEIGNPVFVSEDNNGLFLEMLVVLFSILASKPMSQESNDEFPLLSAEDIEVGPWAYQIPDAFVRLLSQIDDNAMGEIANKWSEAIRQLLPLVTGRSLDLCPEYLESLRRMSIEVLREEKTLFLRVCL